MEELLPYALLVRLFRVSAGPPEEGRKMVLIEKVPFTCKQLMCYLLIQYITFSRNCARKTLLVSVAVREGKYQEHEYLNIFLDSRVFTFT